MLAPSCRTEAGQDEVAIGGDVDVAGMRVGVDDTDRVFAGQASSVLDFTTRRSLQQALAARTGGRLHLDP